MTVITFLLEKHIYFVIKNDLPLDSTVLVDVYDVFFLESAVKTVT